MPRMAVGNSSAVIVHGIVKRPNMEKATNTNRHTTGTQVCCVVPSLIHRVNNPEMNIQVAIPAADTITNGRLLKRFKSHAFNMDMSSRTIPTSMEAVYALTSVPIS